MNEKIYVFKSQERKSTKDLSKQIPKIKHVCYATAYNVKNFCNFMKSIKSDDNKFKALANNLADKIFLLKKEIDLLISVPKYKDELSETDFSLKLAEIISEKAKIPYRKDIIIKTKKTRKLKTIPTEQREKEIENAFEIKNFIDLKNKKICIVDDVLSSGNTVNEMIKTLAGHTDEQNIYVAVLVVQCS